MYDTYTAHLHSGSEVYVQKLEHWKKFSFSEVLLLNVL